MTDNSVAGARIRKQISDSENIRVLKQLSLLTSEILYPKGTILNPAVVCRELQNIREGVTNEASGSVIATESQLTFIDYLGSIDQLELSTSLTNLLQRQGIHTIRDLEMTPEAKLYDYDMPRGFGIVKQAELRNKMSMHDLHFIESAKQIPISYAFRNIRFYVSYYLDETEKTVNLIQTSDFLALLHTSGVRYLEDLNLFELDTMIEKNQHLFAIEFNEPYVVDITREYPAGRQPSDPPNISIKKMTGFGLVLNSVFSEVNKVLKKYNLAVIFSN